jgi:uncharacterized protein
MRILVDADACPVKDVIIKIAKQYEIPVIMYIDTSHEIADGYSEVVTVDKQKDSVDIALANQTKATDIVVTQDHGVAAMVLGKRAKAINQNGYVYSSGNIDALLFERHISQRVRRSGGRTKGPKKRTNNDNKKFEETLRALVMDQ